MNFIVGLDHVTIQIDDGDDALRDAIHFYVDILGLEPLDLPPTPTTGAPEHGSDAVRISSCISSPAPARRRRTASQGAIRRFASRIWNGYASASSRREPKSSRAAAFPTRSVFSCVTASAIGLNSSNALRNSCAARIAYFVIGTKQPKNPVVDR